jgi:hypothetical protein
MPNQQRGKSHAFSSLERHERAQLLSALRGNVERDSAILMDRRQTTFAGTADDIPDNEVITAIQSVPVITDQESH